MVELEQEHKVKFTNQEIIEFAYLVKERIEPLIEGNVKLSFEKANCYPRCFNKCRRLLDLVDFGGSHTVLKDFFKKGRMLSNDWDRLHWMTEEEFKVVRHTMEAMEPESPF